MALRKSIARNSTTGISSGLIQTIEFEEDFVDAIEGVSISMGMTSKQENKTMLFKGEVVLVEFMAYECKPCIWIDPFLENEIAKIYVPMGIKILKES